MTSGISNAVADALLDEVRLDRGWEQPPGVYFMYLSGGRCRLSQLPVPDSRWSGRPLADTLLEFAAMAGEFSRLLQSTTPAELYGAAFRSEAFIVDTPESDTAAFAAAFAAQRARRLKHHPGRVEVRQMWAVDRARVTYFTAVERVTGQIRRRIVPPSPGLDPVGDVADALDQIVTALLGVPLAARSLYLTEPGPGPEPSGLHLPGPGPGA
jgi:hypothetical protein